MPHVDEGTLHALLDGALRSEDPVGADAAEAHLETCADCRALLERAAALRGRSAEVLELLEPAVVPDFEEVLVRAGAAAGGRRRLARQARWTRGLAWAATIVIALGTGYLIRDRLSPERAAMTRAADEAATTVESSAGEAPDVMEAADAPPAADAETEADVNAERPVGGDATVPSTPRTTSREAAAAPTPARQPEVGEAADAPVSEPGPEGDAADGVDAGDRALSPAPDPFQMPERIALESIIVTGVAAPAGAEPGPRVVSAAEALDILGAPLLVLPRAELGEITADEDADGAFVVSLQRVADGAEIRVTQRAPGEPLGMPVDRVEAPARYLDAPSSQDARRALRRDPGQAVLEAAKGEAMVADAAVNTVRVRLDTAELVLEGALPENVLRLLAAGATPLEPEP